MPRRHHGRGQAATHVHGLGDSGPPILGPPATGTLALIIESLNCELSAWPSPRPTVPTRPGTVGCRAGRFPAAAAAATKAAVPGHSTKAAAAAAPGSGCSQKPRSESIRVSAGAAAAVARGS